MTGTKSQTAPSAAGYRTALLSVNTVGKSRPVLRSFAETRAGKKLKERLKKAEGIIASISRSSNDLQPAKPHAPPDPSFPKGCVETDIADLHRDRGSRPQDSSVAPAQQQCKEDPPDALLPAAHSLFPTSSGLAGSTAHNTNLFLPQHYPSTAVAAGLATPPAVEYLPSNTCYTNDGSSPFDQGYLAMNGPWGVATAQHRYL
jgi:hypothetical protein